MSRTLRLGIFIVSTLAVLAAGVFLIGSRQFMFSSTYPLTAKFKNVAGLSEGAEVRVGGIHTGTVSKIKFPIEPTGELTVVMAMEKSTRKVIRQDSVASIQTEGLLGDKYLEISFGSDSAAHVSDGGSIKGVPALEIADMLKKTNEVLDTTKLTMVNVQDSSKQFSEISAKINKGDGTVGALVNDRKFFDELQNATAQAKLGAAAFQENMEAMKHNFFLRGFFNRRGYEDSTKLVENEIPVLPKGQRLKTFSFDPVKIFEKTDSAKLKNEKTLNEAGKFLEQTPFGTAVVVVSGGMKGDAAALEELTKARGMVVRDYLVQHFKMDDSRFKKMGVGKNLERPTENGLVEIIVYSPGPNPK